MLALADNQVDTLARAEPTPMKGRSHAGPPLGLCRKRG